MQPVLMKRQIEAIAAVFKRSRLQMDAVCTVEKKDSMQWKPLFEYNHDRYFFYRRFRADPGQFLNNQLLDIGRYTNALYFYKDNMAELRDQFVFRDNIQRAALKALERVHRKFTASFDSNSTQVLYVGIHCR
jgi:hypothetical protein